jgi:hypothetical protein|tara:strand:- start:18596 stop:18766 length:171 start_codon:yes stop_codon:yes gene_type:complete
MTELETLEKAVVDTKAAYDAAWDAADDAWDAAADAYAPWLKAKLDLNNYLKEQDNE